MRYTALNFVFFTLMIVIVSCTEEHSIPDVSNISVQLEVVRFDQALFTIDSTDTKASLNRIKRRFPAFYNLYFTHVLPLTEDSTQLDKAVKAFVNDRNMRQLYDTTQIVMKDWKKIESEMTNAFKYVKLYLPNFQTPRIFTCISEYSLQRFLFADDNNDGIGIGLDMFLGNEYPYKKIDPTNPNFSSYLTRTFNKEHIVPKTVDIVIDNIISDDSGSRLIDQMVLNGKKLYFKKLFLPRMHDTLIYEYSPSQLKWVEENEIEIWSFFAEQNLVYESVPTKIAKYVNDSPSAPGMPEQAPGKTANYIGLKIIEAYLKQYPSTTIEQLIQLKDAQSILEKSKYKPKYK